MMLRKRIAIPVRNVIKYVSTNPYDHVKSSNNALNTFEQDFHANYQEITPFQRTLLAAGSAVVSLIDPFRHDMIASLGETTGDNALQYMREQMLNTEEGTNILNERPRINSNTTNYDMLKKLPKNTIGNIYSEFLEGNGVTSDSRLTVQFIKDIELAYVMQRYREVHDLIHAVLRMKTTMLGEVTIKWIEALQTKMPMCIGGAILGASRLKTKHRKLYVDQYLPWAIDTGINAKFMQGVYYEKRWEQPIDEFYKEMNINEFKIAK